MSKWLAGWLTSGAGRWSPTPTAAWPFQRPGEGKNWLATFPDKGFFLFHFYGPKQPFFDKSWRPNDIEKIK